MRIKISVLTEDYHKMVKDWCKDVIHSFYPMPCTSHFLISILKKFWGMNELDFNSLRGNFGIEYQFNSRLHKPEYEEIHVDYFIIGNDICIEWKGEIVPVNMIDEILCISSSDDLLLKSIKIIEYQKT